MSKAPPDERDAQVLDELEGDLLQRYLETLALAKDIQSANLRNRKLLSCYAEVQFVLHGGRRCPVCHAHVRHVLPVIAEHIDGGTVEFACLCTRCFEAERAISRTITTHLGRARVEEHAIEYGAQTRDRRTEEIPEKKKTTGNS
jgi:hypothetical protein